MIAIDESRHLERQMQEAWTVSWNRFFLPETSLFYDYVNELEGEGRFRFAPHPEEIAENFPNPCGWGTGMEDSAIHSGVMMAMLCDRFQATHDQGLKDYSEKILRGMESLCRIHGQAGFVARSICPSDGCSVYPETSRDQITHLVHGLWRLGHSTLATEKEIGLVVSLLTDIGRFCEECAKPERDYLIGRVDGRRSANVSGRLWRVAPHEAARLPMFYAACWDMTGDEHWREQCLRYLKPALEQSQLIGDNLEFYPAYSLMQVQCSLEVLIQVWKKEQKIVDLCRRAMWRVADVAEFNAWNSRYGNKDSLVVHACGDWRDFPTIRGIHGYEVPNPPEEWRMSFWRLRELGEAVVAQIMAIPYGRKIHPLQLKMLNMSLHQTDFKRLLNSSLFYLQRAYWAMQVVQSPAWNRREWRSQEKIEMP